MAKEWCYILMKDTPGEKIGNTMKKFWWKITGVGNVVNVLKGELLAPIPPEYALPRYERQSPHSHYVKKDTLPNIALSVEEEDIAPLNTIEYGLLQAIEIPHLRFRVFSDANLLEWGENCKIGDQVFVHLPDPSPASKHESALAVLRYKGKIGNLPGINFGVEIKVRLFTVNGNLHYTTGQVVIARFF